MIKEEKNKILKELLSTGIIVASHNSLGRLGYFDILDVLGMGGKGVVLKARDCELNRLVALKSPRLRYFNNKDALNRGFEEAKAIPEHEYVVNVFDVLNVNGIPVLVMEYLEGGNLGEMIKRQSPFKLEKGIKLIRMIGAGLTHIHACNMVHCDLKPANILLTGSKDRFGNEIIKITDFGLAVSADSAPAASDKLRLAGTPNYMSPEQVMGQSPTVQSDIYSLGVIFHEMLIGKRPYEGNTSEEIMEKVRNEPVPHIRSLRPELTSEIENLLFRLMNKSPKDRPSSVDEFMREMGQAHAPSPLKKILEVIKAWEMPRWFLIEIIIGLFFFLSMLICADSFAYLVGGGWKGLKYLLTGEY